MVADQTSECTYPHDRGDHCQHATEKTAMRMRAFTYPPCTPFAGR